MGKTVQITGLPDAIHRIVEARAAEAGISLSDYLIQEIRKSAERPTNKEMMERLAKLPPLNLGKSAAEIVLEGREERMRELDERMDEIWRGRR